MSGSDGMTRLDWIVALGAFALLILSVLIVAALEWWDGYRERRAERLWAEWLSDGAHELVAGHGARGEPGDAAEGPAHETPRNRSTAADRLHQKDQQADAHEHEAKLARGSVARNALIRSDVDDEADQQEHSATRHGDHPRARNV